MRKTLRIFGTFFKAALVLSLIGGALWLGVNFHSYLNDEVRTQVQKRFADHYVGLDVKVASARVIEGEGLEIRGLTISQPLANGQWEEMLRIEEMRVACRTGLSDLMNSDLGVTKVVVKRPTLRAVRQLDGSWSCLKLFPPPKLEGGTPCQTLVEDATVEVSDTANPSAPRLVLRDVNLEITPRAGEPLPGVVPTPITSTKASGTSLPVAPSFAPPVASIQASAAGENAASPGASLGTPPAYHIKGQMAGDSFRRLHIEADFLGPGQGISLSGALEQVMLSPELRQSLPPELASKLITLRSFRGQADVKFKFVRDGAVGTPWRFQIDTAMRQGTLDDDRLPWPLADVQAKVHCNQHGIKVDSFSARSGPANIQLSLVRNGYAENSTLSISASIKDLSLDARMADRLPASLRTVWQKFDPTGTVDLDADLVFDGAEWKPRAVIRCRDISFCYEKFPYRLDGGTGTIRMQDGATDITMKAIGGGQIIRLLGQMRGAAPQTSGWLEIESEGPLPIDEKLLAALNEKSQRLVRSLSPRGTFTIKGQIQRTLDKPDVWQQNYTIKLRHCGMKFDQFPYPLEGVQGTLQMDDGRWSFKNIEGRNDSGYVTCNGSWEPNTDGGQLALDFIATDIPLEDELRDALNPAAQKLWADFRPRGTLDHVAASVRYDLAKKHLDLDLRIQKWPQQQNIEGRTISVFPTWFPLRFDEVTGTARYRNGVLEMQEIKARHDRAQFAVTGTSKRSLDGKWSVVLEKMVIDQLRTEKEIIAALPEKIGKQVAKLNIQGPLAIRGWLELTGEPEKPTNSRWDLSFDLEQGSLDPGVKLENVFGGVRLTGASDAKGFYSRGEIEIDSLTHKGIQLTQVTGPMWIDQQRMLFGAWSEPAGASSKPRRLKVKAFEGDIEADAQLWLAGEGRYDVQASLADADLASLCRQFNSRGKKITGKASGDLRLGGSLEGSHTLRGDGSILLREADLYELPVMVSLLKILSIRRPDKTAFTSSDIAFRISGEHVYLDKLDFHGDAISLKGNGEVDFARNINLKFYSLMGRGDFGIPILKPVLGEASKQILLIKVAGSLDDPKTTTETLPFLQETLQRLFPEEGSRGKGSQILPPLVMPGERVLPRR